MMVYPTTEVSLYRKSLSREKVSSMSVGCLSDLFLNAWNSAWNIADVQ